MHPVLNRRGYVCVQCFRQVADEVADVVSATGEQAFTANQRYGIVPVLGEGLPGRDNLSNYYTVAVVNAVSYTIQHAKQCTTCHFKVVTVFSCSSLAVHLYLSLFGIVSQSHLAVALSLRQML